jgi:Flp pilus assembly protein CpaB
MDEATAYWTRPAPEDGGNAGRGRAVRPRRTLPGGRAVAGGFLVALAAIGIFAAYTGATSGDSRRYLVASQDLALGHRLSKADLASLPMDLPPFLRGRAYRDPTGLVGAVVIGPVAKGELIQASDVLVRPGGSADREISFPIESARAVDGQLKPGEFVDVLASYGSGNDGYTMAVMRGARVVHRSQPRGTLGDGADEVITLAIPDRGDTLAVAHAVNTGSVTLVRAAAAPDGQGPADGATYRAPGTDPPPRSPR